MQLAHTVVNDTILILQPAGRMDLGQSCEFEVNAEMLLKEKKFHVILDLTDVEYISSSFIRIILSLKKHTYSSDKEFRLCNPNTFCRKIIDIVQIDKLIDIHSSVDEAITSIA